MVSVALINPPSPFLIDDRVMPPLGIMYLSSYLKANGIKVDIFDLAVNSELEDGYDIYAITSTTPQYHAAKHILDILKIVNPNSRFVIGGSHASSFKEQCHNDGFECVIIGEGEKALLSIAKFHEAHGKHNSKLSGILKCAHIEDINGIPFPDRTFKGFEQYNYQLNGHKATTMITSRGCPFDCYFCCNTWGNKVRLRSASNIISEVEVIKKCYGIDAIQFYDDTFTVSRKRVLDICKGLKELGITWRCFVHANTVNRQLLKAMKDSGCVEVGMGVESGSDKILQVVNKQISLNRAIEVCEMCHEIGIRIKTFLMIGLPGESRETVDSTIKFLELARPDDFDITIYTPFPNTRIWDEKEQFDIKFDKDKLDYSKMFYKGKCGKYACQVQTSHLLPSEIEELRDYVDTEVRKRL